MIIGNLLVFSIYAYLNIDFIYRIALVDIFKSKSILN
jgi:hypothetical protein